MANSLKNRVELHNERIAACQSVLNQSTVQGSTLAELGAMKKKHVAFVSELEAHIERCNGLDSIVEELQGLNYAYAGDVSNTVATVKSSYADLQQLSQERTRQIDVSRHDVAA